MKVTAQSLECLELVHSKVCSKKFIPEQAFDCLTSRETMTFHYLILTVRDILKKVLSQDSSFIVKYDVIRRMLITTLGIP